MQGGSGPAGPAEKGPAGLSAEALALVARIERQTSQKNDGPPDLSIADQRVAREAEYASLSSAAIKRYGVTTSKVRFGGVNCLEITPPQVIWPDAIIVYLFGGAFIFGSPEQDLPISAALATETGCRVIAPQYRLAPENPFPAALDDCEAVIRAALSAAPKATLIAGESAGGNLALAVMLRLGASARDLPRALALMSPAADQYDYGDSCLTARDPFLLPDMVQAVPTIYAPGADLRHPDISPVYGQYGPWFPDTLITTGTRDLFLSSCARQARVMREAGANVDLRVWEGMWHVFEHYAELPEASASLAKISAFFTATMNGPDKT